MKFIVCAVRDRAVDQYMTPMFVSAVGQAERAFRDEVNRKQEGNMLNSHPEDFDLYLLGSFDGDSGTFSCDAPRMVAVGKEVVQRAAVAPGQLDLVNGAGAVRGAL